MPYPPMMATEEVEYFGITKQYGLMLAGFLLDKSNSKTWTWFNILCRSATLVLQDAVGYMPTVSFLATDMPTVHEVLKRSMNNMFFLFLKLNSIV